MYETRYLNVAARLLVIGLVCGCSDKDDRFQYSTDEDWAGVSSGTFQTCGVKESGEIVCWGCNERDYGQCDSPIGYKFVSVDTGPYQSCGILEDGSVTCWGCECTSCEEHEQVNYGQCISTDGMVDYSHISSGTVHTCAITNEGGIACWGGESSWAMENAPEIRYATVSNGGARICALDLEGVAYCWSYSGQDFGILETDGSVGISTGTNKAYVINAAGGIEYLYTWESDVDSLPEGLDFQEAGADGQQFGCGRNATGTIQCWGDDAYQTIETPVENFEMMSVGAYHVCGINEDRRIVCWGCQSTVSEINQGQCDPP